MNIRLSILLVVLMICIYIFVQRNFVAANEEKEKTAIESAESWLVLVDGKKYTDCWNEAASYFKSAVSSADWEKMMKFAREPLGKVISRKLVIKTYTTTVPGAPDGEYVVIQYETSFEKKNSAVETITPMLDEDGKWRVAGYYIK